MKSSRIYTWPMMKTGELKMVMMNGKKLVQTSSVKKHSKLRKVLSEIFLAVFTDRKLMYRAQRKVLMSDLMLSA